MINQTLIRSFFHCSFVRVATYPPQQIMAKRLLLDILVKVLGEYIELDAGNFDLSMAVWSGHIALKNLKVSNF